MNKFFTKIVLVVVVVWFFSNGGSLAQEVGPVDNRAYAEDILFLDALIEKEPENFTAYKDRGFCHYELGNNDQAIADFSKSLQGDPASVFSFLYRGRAYLRQENYAAALADFKSAIDLDPDAYGIYVDFSRLYLQMKDYDKAAEYAAKAQSVEMIKKINVASGEEYQLEIVDHEQEIGGQ